MYAILSTMPSTLSEGRSLKGGAAADLGGRTTITSASGWITVILDDTLPDELPRTDHDSYALVMRD
jgi:hypothetical protein